MKKIFSLFMALSILLGVNAAPAQVKSMEKFTKTEKTVKALDQTVAAKKMAAEVKKQKGKSILQSAKAEKHAVTPAAIRRAPQASAEAAEVTATKFTKTYYDEDGDWYCGLVDQEAGLTYYFDILAPASGLVYDKVYTLDDMIENYSGIVWDSYLLNSFTAATFKVSQGANGDDVYATATTDEGEELIITYVAPAKPEITEHKSFVFSADETDLVDGTDSGVFQFTGVKEDTGMEVYVAVLSDHLVGEYSFADLYLDYTSIYVDTEDYAGVEPFDGTVKVEAIEKGYKCTAVLQCWDGVEYTLTLSYVVPDPSDAEMVATNLEIDESLMSWFGVAIINASNEDFGLSLYVYPETGDVYGSYQSAENVSGEIVDYATGKEIELREFDFTIVVDEEGNPTLKGTVLGKNNCTYSLDLKQVFEPTSQEELTLTGAVLYDQIEKSGAITISGANEDGTLKLDVVIYTDHIAGTYEGRDVIDDYNTYVTDFATDDYYDYRKGALTVTLDAEGNFTLTGKMLCLGEISGLMPEYTVNVSGKLSAGLQYDATEADGAFEAEINCDLSALNTAYAEEGIMALTAVNEMGEGVALEFFVNGPDSESILPTGVYFINNSEKTGTVLASNGVEDGYLTYSWAGNKGANGWAPPIWFLVEGTVNVQFVDDQLLIVVNGLNSNGVEVHATVHVVMESHLEYDEQTPFEAEWDLADAAFKDYVEDMGAIHMQAYSADGDSLVSALFFVTSLDEATTVPAGVYFINNSEKTGTVLAAEGVDEQGSVMPSFAATLDGQYLDKIWFLVDGTVNVQNVDGLPQIIINGLNSYNQDIHVVIRGSEQPEGIQSVKGADVTIKAIRNGQLIIERNGVEYIVTGVAL